MQRIQKTVSLFISFSLLFFAFYVDVLANPEFHNATNIQIICNDCELNCHAIILDNAVLREGLHNGAHGIMKNGKLLLDPIYTITETRYIYLIKSPNNKYGYYDKVSGYLQLPVYDAIYDSSRLDCSAPILVKQEGLYKYINCFDGSEVEISIEDICEYSEFRNGYAVITETTIIKDDAGKTQSIIHENMLINIDGEIVEFPVGIYPGGFVQSNGLITVYSLFDDGSKIGLANINGDILLTPQFDWINIFHNGYASVLLDGKWGHIDELGNILVIPTFELDSDAEIGDDQYGYIFSANETASLHLSNGLSVTIDASGNIINDTP